jgi:hypothetical protein
MIAASHPLHVFDNTPAPFGFSHCQKLIGPPSSSVWDTCLLGGEHAFVLTQPWPRMGQTERPQGIADDPQNAPTEMSEFSLPTTAGRMCLGRRKRQVCGMANRVEECLRKAEQCEQAGSFAVTLEARLMFYGGAAMA